MSEAATALRDWGNFFVIVGSSAGALTGLQFVVLTLIADAGVTGRTGEALSAFGSPNVVHFCAALLVSAIFSAPWTGLAPAGVALAMCGVAGVVYSLQVVMRANRQKDYQPVLEDWIWHSVLPLLAYGAMVHSGLALRHGSADTLFIVGAAVLLLVFIGIHNAWDTVTYVMTVMRRPRARNDRERTGPASTGDATSAPAAPEPRAGRSDPIDS